MDRRMRLAKEKKEKQKKAQASMERKAKMERENDADFKEARKASEAAKRVEDLKEKMAEQAEAKAQKEAEEAEAAKGTGYLPRRGKSTGGETDAEEEKPPDESKEGGAPKDETANVKGDFPKKEDGEANIFAEKAQTMDEILEAEEKAKTPSELRLERAINKHRENRVALSKATSQYPFFIGSVATWYAEKRSYFRARWIHYGPPYQPDYGGDLPGELAKDMNIAISDVNAMLNEGADPNIGSLKDLNNCPLHYVARWARARLAKMLFEAGADANKQNELGVTPLGMACMFNQGESEYKLGRKKFVSIKSRRKKHTKFCELLIEHGANVNHIDRGGRTPIEHATFHGNMELVTLLLQKGAKTVRAAEFMSLLQPTPLDYAWKGDVKHILTLRGQVEADEAKAKQAAYQKVLLEKLAAEEYERRYEERRQQRQDFLAEQKRQRVLAEREKAHEVRLRAEEMREKQRKIDMMLKSKHDIVGTWEKAKHKGRWEFFPGTDLASKDANLIADCEYLSSSLSKTSTSGPVIKKRWKNMTGLRQAKPQGPEDFETVLSPKYVLRIPEKGEDMFAELRVSDANKKKGKGIFAGKKGRGGRSPKKYLAQRTNKIVPSGDSRQE